MGPTGKAVGVEHIKELVHESIRNVQEDDPTLLSSGRVKLVGELSAVVMLALASCRALLLRVVDPVWVEAFARHDWLRKDHTGLT